MSTVHTRSRMQANTGPWAHMGRSLGCSSAHPGWVVFKHGMLTWQLCWLSVYSRVCKRGVGDPGSLACASHTTQQATEKERSWTFVLYHQRPWVLPVGGEDAESASMLRIFVTKDAARGRWCRCSTPRAEENKCELRPGLFLESNVHLGPGPVLCLPPCPSTPLGLQDMDVFDAGPGPLVKIHRSV